MIHNYRKFWKIKAQKKGPGMLQKILRQNKPYKLIQDSVLYLLKRKAANCYLYRQQHAEEETQIISKCRHTNKYNQTNYDSMEQNMGSKLNFLEGFEVCGNLIYCNCEED